MSKRPALTALLFLTAAIIFAQRQSPLWVFLAAGGLLGFASLIPGIGKAEILLALAVFAAGSVSAVSCFSDGATARWYGKTAEIEGIVCDADPAKSRLTVRIERADGEKLDGERILLTVKNVSKESSESSRSSNASLDSATQFLPGDRIAFSVAIERPDGLRNPGGFNYRRYLLGKKIRFTAYLDEDQICVTGRSGSPFYALRRLRLRLYAGLSSSMTAEYANLAAGLTIGTSVGEEIRDSFSEAGISHILAVSGLHVGFVSAFVLMLTKKLRRRARFAVSSAVMLGYLCLTGLNASAVRAVLMFEALSGAAAFRRTYDPLSALSLCAVLILLDSPALLWNAGFQLSFSAVLGIALLYAPLNVRSEAIFGKSMMLSSLVLTASATAGTLPVVLAQYYSQPLVSLLSNLLLVPLSGLLVGLSAACLISASFLPQLLPTLSAVFIPAADIFTGAAAFFAELPFPAVAAGTTGFIIAAAVPAVLAGTAGYFRSPVRKRRQVTAMLAGVFVLVLCLSAFRTETRLTVTFLDVGQGDAALIETPEGRVFLIDGGGYERYGQSVTGSTPISERVLLPALASKGISRLDGVFITHNHADHAQGAVELLSLMPAKAVYVNPGWDDTELAERLESSGTIFRRLVRGERFESGGVRFEILSPYDSGIREQDDQNEDSLVIRISFGDHSFLMTGDAGIEAEEKLDLTGIQSTVLKAGHHGSASASGIQFLQAADPDYVVISVGENNRYGHPSAEALSRIEESEAAVLRTDKCGAVEFKTDGKTMSLKRFVVQYDG